MAGGSKKHFYELQFKRGELDSSAVTSFQLPVLPMQVPCFTARWIIYRVYLPVTGNKTVDGSQQLQRFNRFDKIVVGTGSIAPNPVFNLIMGSEHDNFYTAVGSQVLCQHETALVGKSHIQDGNTET